MLKKTWLSLTLAGLSCLAPLSLHAEGNTADDVALPMEDLRLFSEVFHLIRTNYVNEVSDHELLEYAIKGMLGGLDPHSAYLSKNDFSDLQEFTSGEFGGVGIEIIMENGLMKVVSPIDDTPAQKAGIKAGDIILKINNQAIKGLSMDEGIDLMRGKKDSEVTLTILHENASAPVEMTLKRDVIKIKSVKSSLLEKNWGYLRIAQFQSQTGSDARQHLQKMLADTGNQLQGLIIDLRNNPGGILNGAVDIADMFLADGLIVYTQGRTAESRESYQAHAETLMPGKPIVVLINSGSASASEIVAGALQDHKRAIIAGTTSFGKGSVQIILELPDHRGIKLTTARYYTPLGRSIQAEGIKPDITIQNASLTLREESTVEIKEANLSKHLDNKESTITTEETASDQLLNDYQLYEALNLLKTMSITQDMKR